MEIQSVNKQWLVMLPFIFIPKNKIVDFVRYKVFVLNELILFSSEHPELNTCEVLPCLSLNAYDDNC